VSISWGLWAFVLWHLTLGAGGATGSTELLAGSALAAAALLAIAVSRYVAGRPHWRAASPGIKTVAPARERRRPTRAPRACDPDAAGHARPRAPSALPSAA
jgi:hypothetical protein